MGKERESNESTASVATRRRGKIRCLHFGTEAHDVRL
jgi:uncharacterized protein YerC